MYSIVDIEERRDIMPRPRKWKRVCSLPNYKKYGPVSVKVDENDVVEMTVEELETIRMVDLEGMDQVQCAERMGVARSTVQRMYNDARKKVADSIVNGKILTIEGGNYKVCSEDLEIGFCKNCVRRRNRQGRVRGR